MSYIYIPNKGIKYNTTGDYFYPETIGTNIFGFGTDQPVLHNEANDTSQLSSKLLRLNIVTITSPKSRT